MHRMFNKGIKAFSDYLEVLEINEISINKESAFNL